LDCEVDSSATTPRKNRKSMKDKNAACAPRLLINLEQSPDMNGKIEKTVN
jgi:hypothetical protein